MGETDCAPIDGAQREHMIRVITEWTTAEKERRLSGSKTRQDLAQLDSLGRLLGQRQSLFENLAYFHRANPRADCASGLLVLITLLSDNNDGCCTLSVSRLGEILSRSERQIRDALRRLVEAGVMHRETPNGRPWRYWPVVSHAFGDPKLGIPIFIDAMSTPPTRRGRPSKTPEVCLPPLCEIAGGTPPPISKNPGGLSHKPRRSTSTDTTIDTTVRSRSSARAIGISDTQLDQFNWLCNNWGLKANVENPNPLVRNDTDRLLDDELAAFVDEDPQILFGALVAAINDAVAKTRSGGAHTSGISPGLKYLRQTLRGQIQDLKLSIATGQAKARSEKHIQQQLHDSRLVGLNGAGRGKSRARPSWDEAGKSVWGDTETEFEQ